MVDLGQFELGHFDVSQSDLCQFDVGRELGQFGVCVCTCMSCKCVFFLNFVFWP